MTSSSSLRLSGLGWAALAWVLVVYPVTFGLFSAHLPGLSELLETGSRRAWFTFWSLGAAMEWIGFVLCVGAVRREGRSLAEIGIIAERRRVYLWALALTLVFFLAMIAARHAGLYAPLAPATPPTGGRALFTLTSTPERLFWLGMAVTAGVCEETMYRGFALAYLKRLLGSLWLAVPLATFAFAYFHGGFGQGMVLFSVRFGVGLGFVALYLWRRSLLPAIFLHYLIDAALVLAP